MDTLEPGVARRATGNDAARATEETMCRFLLYLGPTITVADCVITPEHSLVHQSVMSTEGSEPFNGDGFGFAWFVPRFGEGPALFKSTKPAWNDRNLHHVARVSESECILAHVRAASAGSGVTQANCHPFVERQYAFMHNGVVRGFHQFRQQLLAGLSPAAFGTIAGTTDSEHMFALFLDALDGAPSDDPLTGMVRALTKVIGTMVAMAERVGAEGQSSLNLAVADGKRAVVSRFITGAQDKARSLYYYSGRRAVSGADGDRMTEPDVDHPSVMIASEPLTGRANWTCVPPNHFVTVDVDRVASLIPIDLG
jgi:predicted glutamine amidotransferase